MKKCPVCNETYMNFNYFCTKDGTALKQFPACKCGEEYHPKDKFCCKCGKKIEREAN